MKKQKKVTFHDFLNEIVRVNRELYANSRNKPDKLVTIKYVNSKDVHMEVHIAANIQRDADYCERLALDIKDAARAAREFKYNGYEVVAKNEM